MFELPTYVEIQGEEYPIRNNGDYRVILDCLRALDDYDLTEIERIYAGLIIFLQDVDTIEQVCQLDIEEATKQMFHFINCGREEQNSKPVEKLIDWEQDEQLICSGINSVIGGKEIRLEPYVHWWTFMGYYMGIGESTLSTVVSIRHKRNKGKKLEKYEQEFIRDHPEYFTWKRKGREQAEVDNLLAQVWNVGLK